MARAPDHREARSASARFAAQGHPAEGTPAVGVVIINHELDEQAVRAVRSALDQDYAGPVVVYFVYDQRAGVEHLVERLPAEVVVLPYTPTPSENPIAAKRNLALDGSTEPFIAFLDDDDLWDRRKLSAQVACLLRDPTAILCCTAWSAGSGRPVPGRKVSSKRRLPRWKVTLARAIATSSTLVRGDAVRDARFDERATWFAVEDYELWLRLARCGRFWRIEEELTVKRPAVGSASSRDRSSQLLRGASVVAEHLRRNGVRPDGVAALLWFLGRACVAERGPGRPGLSPSRVNEILDGTVLGKVDPLVASVAQRWLESRRALCLGRLARRGLARVGRAGRFRR